jgi:outer membrane protein assembly factor BamB
VTFALTGGHGGMTIRGGTMVVPFAPVAEGTVVRVAVGALAVLVAVLVQVAAGPARRPVHAPLTVVELTPGDGLAAVSSGWGDAWVDDRWQERLLRLDGDRGRVVASLPVDGRLALTAGAGAVWALQSGGGYGRGLRGPLLRIDPATNRVTSRIVLRPPWGEPVLGFGVVTAGDSVWVWGPDDLLRIDARTNRVMQAIQAGDDHGELTGLVVLGGEPVVTTADGHILRFDPLTGAERAVPVPLRDPVLQGAADHHLLLTAHGAVAAADPSTGRLLWRTRLGFRLGTVVHHGGVLWANGADIDDPGDRVWKLDGDSGAVLDSALLPEFGTVGIAVVDGALWVTTANGRVLVVTPRLPLVPR